MGLLARLLRRPTPPAYYQAHVKLPIRHPDGEDVSERAAAIAHAFERPFDGRLDVYSERRHVVATTDFVPAEQFDAEAFAHLRKEVRRLYPDPYQLPSRERRCEHAGEPAMTHLVIPVAPLFAARWMAERREAAAPDRPSSDRITE